jgi:hypothetical protein
MSHETTQPNPGDPGFDVFWAEIHSVLERWQKVWQGDKSKYTAQYPKWMVEAAEELFAHDMCDAWDWNEYVRAATVIIARHFRWGGEGRARQMSEPTVKDLAVRHRSDSAEVRVLLNGVALPIKEITGNWMTLDLIVESSVVEEVSPAPMPRKCICGHGLTAHGLGNGMCLVVGCKCAQMREDKFAEGGESAESEPNKATIPAQVGELIAPPLRNEPSAISNESSLGELKAALRKMTVEFRKHFREGDHTLHWRDALDSLTEAERVLARVSEGSGA